MCAKYLVWLEFCEFERSLNLHLGDAIEKINNVTSHFRNDLYSSFLPSSSTSAEVETSTTSQSSFQGRDEQNYFQKNA